MRVAYTSFTECGRRSENQDYLRVLELGKNRFLFVLADGMGGHHYGACSSRVVCNAFCEYWLQHIGNGFHESFISEAALQAFNELKRYADRKKGVKMGTTIVGAYMDGCRVHIFHCGDSRCYLFRNPKGCISQTCDHVDFSLGWEVFERCFISDKPQKAIPEVCSLELQEGDRLFLCSDGVHKRIPYSMLDRSLQAEKSLDAIVYDVKDLCDAYSDDNYSGILIEL